MKDTLKSPPPENQTMKKASVISVAITTFFYLCCGSAGYAAFGNDTPGNLLTGFGSSKLYWLLDFANVCIVVHLVGSYQVHIINVQSSNFEMVLPYYMSLWFLYCLRVAYYSMKQWRNHGHMTLTLVDIDNNL